MKNDIQVTCADGTVVSTVEYVPSGTAQGAILMAGATAVPQGFYRRFAEHANQQGFAVRTLDYRGIGKSAPPTLRGYRMNYLDWARQDLVATLESLQSTQSSGPIYMVGHSYGGHAFGLMPNHAKIKKFYTFASGAGWAGHMPASERRKVWIMWNVLGPIITPLLGYMPGQIIGGDNLPIDVYHQWKRWCSFPHYFFDDPLMTSELSLFSQVKTPIAAANATDDLWALPVSRDHFMKGYSAAPIQAITLDPVALGMPSGIGHMGYFRKGSEKLWDDALAWLMA